MNLVLSTVHPLVQVGVMVISDEFSIPEIAARTIQFYNHESHADNVHHAVMGSGMISMLLKKIADGKGEKDDIDRIIWLCDNIKGNTLCPTGEAYSSPIKTMVTKFRSDFEALIKK
jgi:NADH:ubiquinone oxidoreductase subunit F (NADH-binding)